MKQRLIKAAVLAIAVLSAPLQAGAQTAPQSLTPQQKEEVEKLIGDYIRTNPRIILEAIELLRQQERASQEERISANIARLKDQIINDPSSPVGGNANGDVTVVEFFDYRCGYCKQVFASILSLLKEDKNIRYVFKEFPILSPASELASRAALAAWLIDKDKYVKFHTELMTTRGEISESRVLRMASGVGLDSGKIAKAMKSPEVDEALKRNFALAEELSIKGTPAFIIGDKLIPGAAELATIKQLVAEARQKK